MNAWNGVLLVVGLASIVVALLAMSGVVPVGSVLNGPNASGSGLNVLVGKFNWTTTGLRVNISAANILPSCPSTCVVTPSFATSYYFGDQIGLSCASAATCSTRHNYASAGSYTITEIVREFIGTKLVASVAVSAAVSVPSASSGSVTSGYKGTTNAFIGPSFAQNATGLSAFFTDTSTYANETAASVVWSFGDGINITGKQGGMAPHRYATGGTYAVTLTIVSAAVVSTPSGGTQTATYVATQNITVQPLVNVTSQNSNPYSGGVSPGWYTPANVALLVFGSTLAVMQLIPVVDTRHLGTFLLSGLAGVVVYFTVLWQLTGVIL